MRQIAYRGPADRFDTGSMFDGKSYQFFAPGATTDFDGQPLAAGEAGKAVAVNNDHVERLLTYPYHHFVEVEGEAPPVPDVPASTNVVADAKSAAKEKER